MSTEQLTMVRDEMLSHQREILEDGVFRREIVEVHKILEVFKNWGVKNEVKF